MSYLTLDGLGVRIPGLPPKGDARRLTWQQYNKLKATDPGLLEDWVRSGKFIPPKLTTEQRQEFDLQRRTEERRRQLAIPAVPVPGLVVEEGEEFLEAYPGLPRAVVAPARPFVRPETARPSAQRRTAVRPEDLPGEMTTAEKQREFRSSRYRQFAAGRRKPEWHEKWQSGKGAEESFDPLTQAAARRVQIREMARRDVDVVIPSREAREAAEWAAARRAEKVPSVARATGSSAAYKAMKKSPSWSGSLDSRESLLESMRAAIGERFYAHEKSKIPYLRAKEENGWSGAFAKAAWKKGMPVSQAHSQWLKLKRQDVATKRKRAAERATPADVAREIMARREAASRQPATGPMAPPTGYPVGFQPQIRPGTGQKLMLVKGQIPFDLRRAEAARLATEYEQIKAAGMVPTTGFRPY